MWISALHAACVQLEKNPKNNIFSRCNFLHLHKLIKNWMEMFEPPQRIHIPGAAAAATGPLTESCQVNTLAYDQNIKL